MSLNTCGWHCSVAGFGDAWLLRVEQGVRARLYAQLDVARSAARLQECALLRVLEEDMSRNSDEHSEASARRALEALGGLLRKVKGSPFALAAPLSKALADCSLSVRSATARLVSDLGDAIMLEDVALFDEAVEVRLLAVDLLLGLKATEGLHHVALRDPELSVRTRTVVALGQLRAIASYCCLESDHGQQLRTLEATQP
jgi:hypothetical protein